MRLLVLLVALAACGPSPGYYEWVEEPAERPTREDLDPALRSGVEQRRGWPCAGSTAPVRQRARQGRYRGVEGFDARGCVGPSTDERGGW